MLGRLLRIRVGRLRNGCVIFAFAILQNCAAGESGVDDVEVLQLLADLRGDTTQQHNVWAGDGVVAAVFGAVAVVVEVVNVVQEAGPKRRIDANEVNEFVCDKEDFMHILQRTVRPRADVVTFAVNWVGFAFCVFVQRVPGDEPDDALNGFNGLRDGDVFECSDEAIRASHCE